MKNLGKELYLINYTQYMYNEKYEYNNNMISNEKKEILLK